MDGIDDLLNVAAIATVGYLGWKRQQKLKAQLDSKKIVKNVKLRDIRPKNVSQVQPKGQIPKKKKVKKNVLPRLKITRDQRREFTSISSSSSFYFWLHENKIEKNDFDVENLMDVDDRVFHIMTRMSKKIFFKLLSMLEDKLEKYSQRMSVSPKIRLFVALTYLAHGLTPDLLGYIFRLGRTTVRHVVNDVCLAVKDNLLPAYLPAAADAKWHEKVKQNEEHWGLPNCVSVLDYRTLHVVCRDKSYAKYWVSQCKLPICIMFACDSNYNFTGVSLCVYNAEIGPAYAKSTFGEQLLKGKIKLPAAQLLKNSDINMGHYFAASPCFTMKTNVMRAYGKGEETNEKAQNIYFNKLLQRSRRSMDNCMGMLLYKWRILRPCVDINQDTVERVVMSVVVLHNFLKIHEPTYLTEHDVDQYDEISNETISEGNWRGLKYTLPLAQPAYSNNASKSAFEMRDQLANYLFTASND